MKLYLVSGAHHDVPNILSSAHLTSASAEAEALRLVNMIRDDSPRDGLDSDEATPSLAALPAGADWREGLREAQRCIISFKNNVEFDAPALRDLSDDALPMNSRANVEIVELDVKGLPDMPAVLEDYLAAGQAAVEHMRGALGTDERPDSDSAHIARDLADALQMMRLAAIWRAQPAETMLQETHRIMSDLGDKIAGDRGRADHLPGDLLGTRPGAGHYVAQWEREYLAADGVHWGDKIDWSTAKAIASRLDGVRA